MHDQRNPKAKHEQFTAVKCPERFARQITERFPQEEVEQSGSLSINFPRRFSSLEYRQISAKVHNLTAMVIRAQKSHTNWLLFGISYVWNVQ